MDLLQDAIRTHGFAIQCAVTTEDPAQNFRPDTGRIEAFRAGEGNGIRLDGASGFTGAVITPFYDSLLVKVIALAPTFESACSKLRRCLAEFRIRGVKTNIPFLLNVFQHEIFLSAKVDTHFIDDHPELFQYQQSLNRGQKLLTYMAEILVNGPKIMFMTDRLPSRQEARVPTISRDKKLEYGLKKILKDEGPNGFVKAVRNSKSMLITDTTLRDAHQCLLGTMLRTYDMLRIAPFVAHNFSKFYSLENWGDYNFQCALKYLKESPWERLEQLRTLIPNIPFQMVLRGANGVGFRNYPDNVIFEFCKLAFECGIDIFRVCDCFNYVPNIILGIEAAGKAGGVVEAAMVYASDLSNPKKSEYDLNYYTHLAGELVKAGSHVLCIKDTAGLLKPQSARILVKALRDKFPEVPLHVHTHDSSGVGLASMVAAIEEDADVIDLAVNSLSGTVSQPSIGALVAILKDTKWDTDLSLAAINKYSEYWEEVRLAYKPFECTEFVKSGNTNVYDHEIPGTQYAVLKFRARKLGTDIFSEDIQTAFINANNLLGDIIKAAPSETVVGDLALFMLETGLKPEDIEENAQDLMLPVSVIDYFQGNLGEPHKGFPEVLRKKVLRDVVPVSGRPGASLPPIDLTKLGTELRKEFPEATDKDVISAAFFPKDTAAFFNFRRKYGPVDKLDTASYFIGPKIGQEYLVTISEGAILSIYALAISSDVNLRGEREVFFEYNGGLRNLYIRDMKLSEEYEIHPKAEKGNKHHIGAPMPGIVKEIRISVGDTIKKGSTVVILTAMKMESVVQSPHEGIVDKIHVEIEMHLMTDDLLVTLK
ncbi:hypothetical protein FQR65_LT04385 [Abscondita terminalis]|nr:hypothetical protein FQR65_LT04385 [Abscondita terminalis]